MAFVCVSLSGFLPTFISVHSYTHFVQWFWVLFHFVLIVYLTLFYAVHWHHWWLNVPVQNKLELCFPHEHSSRFYTLISCILHRPFVPNNKTSLCWRTFSDMILEETWLTCLLTINKIYGWSLLQTTTHKWKDYYVSWKWLFTDITQEQFVLCRFSTNLSPISTNLAVIPSPLAYKLYKDAGLACNSQK